MSSEAVSWALNSARTGPISPDARLVLVSLADYAHPDGTGAFPSVATLAARLGVTERSVRRGLATLAERGLIRRGDQALVSHYRPDRRPVVWELVYNAQDRRAPARHDDTVTSRVGRGDAHDMSSASERGDESVRHGVTRVSPKPKTEPNYIPTPTPSEHAERVNDVDPRTGAHRVCGVLHPAGTSCPNPAPKPANFRALVEHAASVDWHHCRACGTATLNGELCTRCEVSGLKAPTLMDSRA